VRQIDLQRKYHQSAADLAAAVGLNAIEPPKEMSSR